ncbi:MAG: NAD-dependent epimerase/dehydratase family protein [Acidimicrobiia bacterium]
MTTSPSTVLVTGGAGFIGSHVVEAFLDEGWNVRVLDDCSTGIATQVCAPAELTIGTITDPGLVGELVSGCHAVAHLAAIGSVPRSVENPLATHHANATGSLTVLDAAVRASVPRVVVASSSSVYGGSVPLPASDTGPVYPRSPYAVSKYTMELYARVMHELHALESVALRFFNVFGPRQRPDSAYAAVIPRFVDAALNGQRPQVDGDGLQTRDFTFVKDVAAAVVQATIAPAAAVSGGVFNIARGEPHSLLDLLEHIGEITGTHLEPAFRDARAGDVRESHADISSAKEAFQYKPSTTLRDGLIETVDAMRAAFTKQPSGASK